MITEIKAEGFKGMDFTQDLSEKNLIIGRNGSGKSARSIALMLLCLGYVPGTAKQNAAILDNFGAGEKLFVSGEIKKTHYLRRFSRDKKGTVKQDFLINRRKANKSDFIEKMAKAGAPSILDLGEAFLDLSDQKKIDYLFDLFPPGDDVSKLDVKIEELTYDLLSKQKSIKGKESVVSELMKAKAEIELPSGSLAEIRDEIGKTKDEYKACNAELSKAREDLAALEATKKAEKEAEEKRDLEEKARKAKLIDRGPANVRDTEKPEKKTESPGIGSASSRLDPDERNRQNAESSLKRKTANIPTTPDPLDSINRIMAVAEKVDAMAVVLQCKKESMLFLRKEAA